MGDGQDDQSFLSIVDLVDDSIVADPDSIEIGGARQLYASGGPSVLLQGINRFAQASIKPGIAQGAEKFLSSSAEENQIGHLVLL